MSTRRERAVVLYNAPVLASDHPDSTSEADVVQVADAVGESLARAGFEVHRLAATPPLSDVLGALVRFDPDVVFNLIEGFGGKSANATHVTGLLEVAGFAYTGSPVECLAVCAGKSRTKALLRGYGLPTAPFARIAPGQPLPEWDWAAPAIVKPDAEDGSLGIDQESVVLDAREAALRVDRIHRQYGGPALLEAYLPGPEFNVGILAIPEPEALPIAEIIYSETLGTWPILTYDAKWLSGSSADLATPVRCPARISTDLADRLRAIALAAFHATDCRDYARVDLRLDGGGNPMILEVNPNPDIGPDAGWARAARASGRAYSPVIAEIARCAMARRTADASLAAGGERGNGLSCV